MSEFTRSFLEFMRANPGKLYPSCLRIWQYRNHFKEIIGSNRNVLFVQGNLKIEEYVSKTTKVGRENALLSREIKL